MSGKPFDASLKDVIEAHADNWARLLGASSGSVRLIDADVSTITAAADNALLIKSKKNPGRYNFPVCSALVIDRQMDIDTRRFSSSLSFTALRAANPRAN